jgi:HD-GYP domain-containing protein (c-di-GMP phosphodiesterase class II)
MSLIRDGRDSHFDPEVVDAFERLMAANSVLRRPHPVAH